MLIVFKLPELSRSCSKRIVNISIISINDQTACGEFSDLYLKSVQENSVYKEPCALKGTLMQIRKSVNTSSSHENNMLKISH